MDNQDPNKCLDKDVDKNTKPAISPPGQQPDQEQQPEAPLQPPTRPLSGSNSWIPPSTGNPDLDPAGFSGQRLDLRERDPLRPQGMIFDPRSLLDAHRHQIERRDPNSGLGLPPGARFDPYGPPDPYLVGPGRGPLPSQQYGVPDPDHMQPPGIALPGANKTVKRLDWPPGSKPGGHGGPPSGPPGGFI